MVIDARDIQVLECVAHYKIICSMFEEYNYLFKIVVIGDSGVGKTNLVGQFVDEVFKEDEKPTVGVQFSSKVIEMNGHDIRCQIWDTAGQERFRAVTKAYYNGAVGALVVFDITNSKSFENITKWIDEAEQNTKKDTVILIIGNKDDLQGREVSQVKVQQLIQRNKNRMLYMQTSALNGHNVKDAFKALVEEIYKQKQRQLQILKKQAVNPDRKEEPTKVVPTKSVQRNSSAASQRVSAVRISKGAPQNQKATKKCC